MDRKRVLEELSDGTYPPRPEVDLPVTYIGESMPKDEREGDWWVQPDDVPGFADRLLHMLRMWMRSA